MGWFTEGLLRGVNLGGNQQWPFFFSCVSDTSYWALFSLVGPFPSSPLFVKHPWPLSSQTPCCQSVLSGKEYGEGGRSIRLDFKSFISLIFIKGCQWTQAISLTWFIHNGPEERLIRKQMHLNAFLTWIIYWRQNCWLWVPKIIWLTVSLFLEVWNMTTEYWSTEMNSAFGVIGTGYSSKSFINNSNAKTWSRAFALSLSFPTSVTKLGKRMFG